MVIFAGGKFHENFGKTFHVGVIFDDTSHISFTKSWVLFSCGGNFREEDNITKKRENYPHANISMFTVVAKLGL